MSHPSINFARMIEKSVVFDSVGSYNMLYGLPTLHPLVSVVDLSLASSRLNHVRITYGVYAVFIKRGAGCSIHYGRRKYDYQEGTVVTFAPGQVVDLDMDDDVAMPSAVGVIFHPDLIFGTPLADKIADFSFFDYDQMEALHVSEDERQKLLSCMSSVDDELRQPVDEHSAALLSANIQVLLEYLHRFYDRQFITRHKANSDVVRQFQKDLKEYYESDRRRDSMPNVAYFADRACLSPGYFGDLIRKETGSSPKDLIALHLVAVAKHRLLGSNDDINRIAYDLGFEYPAHFSRMFKRMTGTTPSLFRHQNRTV